MPLRDDAGVTLGTATLPVLFVASLALTLVAAPSASALFQWHSHKGRALHILYRIMAAVTVGALGRGCAQGLPEGDGSRDSSACIGMRWGGGTRVVEPARDGQRGWHFVHAMQCKCSCCPAAATSGAGFFAAYLATGSPVPGPPGAKVGPCPWFDLPGKLAGWLAAVLHRVFCWVQACLRGMHLLRQTGRCGLGLPAFLEGRSRLPLGTPPTPALSAAHTHGSPTAGPGPHRRAASGALRFLPLGLPDEFGGRGVVLDSDQ